MRLGGVALGGRGVADDGAKHDQRGAIGGLARAAASNAAAIAVEVVAVAHLQHLPAVGLEPALHVLGEGQRGVAVDGDVVVVVDHGELAEPEVPGERRGLARHAFHQVAVAGERPGPVIHDLVSGPVELLGQEALGDRHPDRVAEPLAQRAGGGLDARRVAALRMARGAASPTAGRP